MTEQLQDGYYRLYSPSESEPTLAYLYDNPDAEMRGFGLNIRDGGGFVPLSHLASTTRVVPVEITDRFGFDISATDTET